MRPKRAASGVMHGDAIAPRADGLDAVIAFAELEFGAFERLLHPLEPVEQGFAIRHHQADDAAQHVGLAHRQVELAHADIDPHVAGAGVEKRIARIAEPGDVKMRRQVLVVDADIDVADADDIADILGGAVVLLLWHCSILVSSWGSFLGRY